MKANDFIRNCGIDSAKTILSMGDRELSIPGYKFHTDEIKRLVASHEIVRLFKSIYQAKIEVQACEHAGHSEILVKLDYGMGYISVSKVKQAIADVESCQ